MAKFYVNDADGKKLPGVFESRADAEHAVERVAAEFALGFSIISDDSEDQARYQAEAEREKARKASVEHQRKEQEKFAALRQ